MTFPACIALGSNLGDRRATIISAFDALAQIPSTTLDARSELVETEPVGPIDQPSYLNAAALIHTLLTPRDLLDALFLIERDHHRNRAHEQRWGPRTLDLDLLLYDDKRIEEPGLTVPHPRLHERLFVLEPLAQVAPGMVVPGLERSVADLLAKLRDTEGVNQ